MCRLLGGRWGLYAWRQRQGAPEKQAAENAQLSAEIQAVLQAVLQEHRGFYGSPRIHQELRAARHPASRHRFARRMRRADFRARTCRPFRPCSRASRGASGVVDNLLHQDFRPSATSRCWAGDFIYIRIAAGRRYLAVWINLCTRRVFGWKLDARMDAALVIEALHRALGQRQVEPEQLLLNRDQGSQSRASDYRELLCRHAIVCSMSARGCCRDNTVVESLFSTLKFLELHLDDNREEPISPKKLQRELGLWIEGCNNRKRRHSTMGNLSPIDYEQQFIAAPTLTPINP